MAARYTVYVETLMSFIWSRNSE